MPNDGMHKRKYITAETEREILLSESNRVSLYQMLWGSCREGILPKVTTD